MSATHQPHVSGADGRHFEMNLSSEPVAPLAFALTGCSLRAKFNPRLFFGSHLLNHRLPPPIHGRLRPRLSRRPLPMMSAGKDPVESQVRAELEAEGINLDELLNGGKVVSLTRKLDGLQRESKTLLQDSEKYDVVQKKIDKLQNDITREKRQVMQTWLKQLFIFQALAFLVVGAFLSFDAVPGYSVPLVGQALGFWTTWLFTIPALRARKGTTKAEKSALNISFLAIPIVNVCLPAVTKNCGVIWTADVFVLAGFYVYYFARSYLSPQESGGSLLREQGAIKGILKYLDWGSWR